LIRPETSLLTPIAAAQASQKAPSTSSKSWILVSTLPPEFKFNPVILPPTKAPSENTEATYTALYSFIIALILLNNGSLPEAKLERYLKRANADQWTPIMSTEKLLQKLAKEGYLEKRRDTSTGEEIIEWVVGPRGKIEVGERGVQGFVRAVHGASGEEDEELERKLDRSLGLQDQQRIVVEGTEEAPQTNGNAEQPRRTRGRARRDAGDESDDD
jgi:melanoma-associated antigen